MLFASRAYKCFLVWLGATRSSLWETGKLSWNGNHAKMPGKYHFGYLARICHQIGNIVCELSNKCLEYYNVLISCWNKMYMEMDLYKLTNTNTEKIHKIRPNKHDIFYLTLSVWSSMSYWAALNTNKSFETAGRFLRIRNMRGFVPLKGGVQLKTI